MKNKKWMFVGLAVLIIIGIVGFLTLGPKSDEEKIREAEEEMFPKMDVGSVPGLTYIEPAEAKGKLQVSAQVNKEHWERIGAFSVQVEVKNKTDNTLLRAVVTHTLIDKSGNVIGMKNSSGVGSEINNIKPGESGTANLEMLVVSEKTKDIGRLEYSLKNIQFSGEATTAPAPTPEKPEPEEIKPEDTEPEESNVYTASNYPRDPQTPEGSLAAFFFLCNKGDYTAAEIFCTEGFIDENGSVKAIWSRVSGGALLSKIEITEGRTYEDRGEASRDIILHFEDNSTFSGNPSLEKEDGIWKIDG